MLALNWEHCHQPTRMLGTPDSQFINFGGRDGGASQCLPVSYTHVHMKCSICSYSSNPSPMVLQCILIALIYNNEYISSTNEVTIRQTNNPRLKAT